MMPRTLLAIMTLLFYVQTASATERPSDPISSIDYFQEASGERLPLQQVQQHFQQGKIEHADRRFLTFGISHKATWVRLSLNNPLAHALRRRLTAGQTWLESVDVYLVTENGHTQHWHSGDAQKADAHLLPVIGFVFDMNIPRGKSEIFIRGETFDPLTMPIKLLSTEEARTQATETHLASGILYGILLTLVGLNLVLYITLKRPYTLHYSIYIGCFIVMNFGYAGYAFAWFYPDSTAIQNYCTLFFMVLHGVCGLIFVSSLLNLPSRMPKLLRAIHIYIAAGLAAIIFPIFAKSHFLASLVAFGFLSATTLLMILVGIMSLRKTQDALYFLIAVCCSMLGLLTTTLSVWGFIPYTFYGFHSAEVGVVLEAIILAAIIANRLKTLDNERVTAQYLATHDPLTQLFNRRSFENSAHKCIQQENNHQKTICFVIMDIDHFKSINDTHGHHVGDLALKHIARLLRHYTRHTDIVARWGGEEMVILLPETEMTQAVAIAEKLRSIIQNTPFNAEGKEIWMTASFGVSSKKSDETLEQLFKRADDRLYAAKRQGRNHVESELESTAELSLS